MGGKKAESKGAECTEGAPTVGNWADKDFKLSVRQQKGFMCKIKLHCKVQRPCPPCDDRTARERAWDVRAQILYIGVHFLQLCRLIYRPTTSFTSSLTLPKATYLRASRQAAHIPILVPRHDILAFYACCSHFTVCLVV
jgi:hypothetical protein